MGARAARPPGRTGRHRDPGGPRPARLEEELARLFTEYDLTNADFVVISSLRRVGQPYELSQSTLVQRLGLTSGTVSVRLTRLAAKEVVLRRPHPEDSRGALIRLTERGWRSSTRSLPPT